MHAGESGFSLLQIVVSITILGILGGMAAAKWSRFARKQELIGGSKSVLAFLQEARSHGAKKNLRAGVKFDKTASSLALFEDRNRNGALDAGESVRTLPLSRGLRIGLPDLGPTAGPSGQAVPAGGLEGAWVQGWTADIDPSAPSGAGAVYLSRAGLDRFSVCIAQRADSRKPALFLWSGEAWVEL